MAYTKVFLKQTLDDILKALYSKDIEPYDWYGDLFPAEIKAGIPEYNQNKLPVRAYRTSAENVLASKAICFPDLHERMRQIVFRITEINNSGLCSELWETDRDQAGSGFARELALCDIKNIPIYYEYLKSNDLIHEFYQSQDIFEIVQRWNFSKETYPLIIFRGLHGQECRKYKYFSLPACKTQEEAEEYYHAAAEYLEASFYFSVDEDEIEDSID